MRKTTLAGMLILCGATAAIAQTTTPQTDPMMPNNMATNNTVPENDTMPPDEMTPPDETTPPDDMTRPDEPGMDSTMPDDGSPDDGSDDGM